MVSTRHGTRPFPLEMPPKSRPRRVLSKRSASRKKQPTRSASPRRGKASGPGRKVRTRAAGKRLFGATQAGTSEDKDIKCEREVMEFITDIYNAATCETQGQLDFIQFDTLLKDVEYPISKKVLAELIFQKASDAAAAVRAAMQEFECASDGE